MTNDQGKELAHTSAQTPELRQLERLPNESKQAHAARMAFCRLRWLSVSHRYCGRGFFLSFRVCLSVSA